MKQETKIIEATEYLLGTIMLGVINNDKDCISSHLRDLTCYLDEKCLLGDR